MQSDSARKAVRKTHLLATGIAATLVLGVGLFAWRIFGGDSEPDGLSLGAKTGFPATASVIVSIRNHGDCRQYRLDNTTGGLSDQGIMDCPRPPKAIRSPLGTVAAGFRGQ